MEVTGGFRFVLLILFVLANNASAAENDTMDVMLLLDSSDSFRSANFESEKMLALNIAKRLFKNNNRLGLYTFGANTHQQFPLSMYHNMQQVTQAVNYMWLSTGNGKLASALNYTIRTGFAKEAGDRECIPNVLIILTHLTISDEDVSGLSKMLEKDIIQPFIIDMAHRTTTDDDFTSLTNDGSRVFKINTFEELIPVVDNLTSKIYSDLPRTGCGVLSVWGSWSRCSRTCNSGLKLRMRSCVKVKPTDRNCDLVLSEDQPCNLGACTESIDGSWANWGTWEPCSQTCGNGTQLRRRSCDEPLPVNGGKQCPGTGSQTRMCAEWKCPDCAKTCPAGGHLNKECDLCVCTSVTLNGRVLDNLLNAPVKQGLVFLDSRRYTAIAVTNQWGYFNATGICLLNTTVYVQAIGYSGEHITPSELNSTHWTLNGTLLKYVPPLFKVHPVDKIRMVGQDMTLCCEAAGIPKPTIYKWFKNGIELETFGVDGTFNMTAIKKEDAGDYMCSAETDAGVSRSESAEVTVMDNSGVDTCSPPTSKLQVLPEGCYVTGDSNRNNTIDVKMCGKGICMTSSLRDNGTCSDWWSHQCCDVDSVQMVDITCDGYTYQKTSAKSCKCRSCSQTTIIAGRVFARKDGKEVPFQLGTVLSNGREVCRTNMAGYFRFEVPKGSKRIITTFHDEVFKKFVDGTKIINVIEGIETHVTIVLPLKPVPVPFTPTIGTSIQLGGDSNGMPAAGSVSIEEDSLMTADGHPYKGPAKASVHFMDPRKRDDLESANGDFVYESQGGDKLPLRTFGMFHVGVEDNDGNELNINKDISFTLDASLFNITLDKDGNPDLALWYYDSNKGIWVEQSRMQFSGQGSGRRRLLSGMLTGTVPPVNVPTMDPFTYKTERRWTGGYTNCDHSVKIYENVQIKSDNPKDGVCFVSVSVYKDFTLKEVSGGDGIRVTAFSQELDGSAYLATETKSVDETGHVCLTVFCDKLVYIYAKGKGGTRLFPTEHFLPFGYPDLTKPSDTEAKFESRYFGAGYDCAIDTRTNNCHGPVFPYSEANVCQKSKTDTSFRFRFAPFTKEPTLDTILGSEEIYDNKLSWYPISPERKLFRTCFIKATIKVKDQYDIRLSATSYLDGFAGEQLGTYDVGPIPSPDLSDTSVRAACIEYRCAGYVKDGYTVYYDKETAVDVRIKAGGKHVKCSFRKLVDGINVTASTDGFRFVAESGRNYGPSFGIFVNDADKSTVQSFCYSGTDFSSHVDGLMAPTKNSAVEFDCNK